MISCDKLQLAGCRFLPKCSARPQGEHRCEHGQSSSWLCVGRDGEVVCFQIRKWAREGDLEQLLNNGRTDPLVVTESTDRPLCKNTALCLWKADLTGEYDRHRIIKVCFITTFTFNTVIILRIQSLKWLKISTALPLHVVAEPNQTQGFNHQTLTGQLPQLIQCRDSSC